MSDDEDDNNPIGPNDNDFSDEEEIDNQELTEEEQRPVYERVLRERLEKLTVELTEKQTEKRKLHRGREETGVQLYGIQQQLAKLQMQLEASHEDYNEIHRLRLQSEEETAHANQVLEERTAEIAANELDKLNAALKQVEDYSTQMKSEIAITRRATYKTDETVGDLERKKQQQDFMLDEMTEQSKRLHEQLALYEAQLLAQGSETKAAHDTLAEAQREMDEINAEKKQLLQQWQSSVIGMQRRDEALKATEDALAKQREQLMVLENEQAGLRLQIKQEQDTNEKVTQMYNKVQTEAEFLKKCLDIMKERRQKLDEQYAMLKQSLEQTDEQMSKVIMTQRQKQDELALVQKTLQAVAANNAKLDEQIQAHLSNHETLQKCSQSTRDVAAKLRKHVHEKEMQITQLNNDLARIRIDTLNTSAHNEALKKQRDSILAQLTEKEKLIDKYEVEIRRRNDELEKKQSSVDALNRKYDALTSNVTDENTGPLEATIHNLQKSIAEKQRESQDMQHQWVKRQTELVALAGEISEENEQIQHLRAQYSVQQQKKLRMEAEYKQEQQELKDIEHAIRNAHIDMGHLNDLISRNGKLRQECAEQTINLEAEIQHRLKDLEGEAEKISGQIEFIASEKQRLLADIVEAEKRIMAWERKIQLSKEMQTALDPEVGQAETFAMRKEIQRMTLRYQQLQKTQRDLMSGMEKAIYKSESIAVSGKLKASKSKGETMATLRRAIESLNADIQRIHKDAQTCEEEAKQYEIQQKSLEEELKSLREQCDAAHAERDRLETSLHARIIKKTRLAADSRRLRKLATNYQAAREGKYRTRLKDDAAAELELAKCRRQLETISRIITQMQASFDRLAEPLEELRPSD